MLLSAACKLGKYCSELVLSIREGPGSIPGTNTGVSLDRTELPREDKAEGTGQAGCRCCPGPLPSRPPGPGLPVGVGSAAVVRESREALREGAGGPVRKEAGAPKWGSGAPALCVPHPSCRAAGTYGADARRSLQRSQSCSPGSSSTGDSVDHWSANYGEGESPETGCSKPVPNKTLLKLRGNCQGPQRAKRS